MSSAHIEAKTEELEMPWPDRAMPVTTENELELEGEQAIPLHRHGFEAVVFHPAMTSAPERSLRMDSCVMFGGRGGLPPVVAAAAMETCRHKKESRGSGSEKPWLEQERYLLLSPMAAGPGLLLLDCLPISAGSISSEKRKKIFSLGFWFLGNHGYLVLIFLGFARHLSAVDWRDRRGVEGAGILSLLGPELTD